MRDDELIAYWLTQGVNVSTFSRESLRELSFQASTVELLSIVGLPTSAAPYLLFAESPSEFKCVRITYQPRDDFAQYELGNEGAHLVEIGVDGAGDGHGNAQ